jgi:hypothetical protein
MENNFTYVDISDNFTCVDIIEISRVKFVLHNVCQS